MIYRGLVVRFGTMVNPLVWCWAGVALFIGINALLRTGSPGGYVVGVVAMASGSLAMWSVLRCKLILGADELVVRNFVHTHRFPYDIESLVVRTPDPASKGRLSRRDGVWFDYDGESVLAHGARVDNRGGRRDDPRIGVLKRELERRFHHATFEYLDSWSYPTKLFGGW